MAASADPLQKEHVDWYVALSHPSFAKLLWNDDNLCRMHREWFFDRQADGWTTRQALAYLSRFMCHDPRDRCFVFQASDWAHDAEEYCILELFKANPGLGQPAWSFVLSPDEADMMTTLFESMNARFRFEATDAQRSSYICDALGRVCTRISFSAETARLVFQHLSPEHVMRTWLSHDMPQDTRHTILLACMAHHYAWNLSTESVRDLFSTSADPLFTETVLGRSCEYRNTLLKHIYRNTCAIEARARK